MAFVLSTDTKQKLGEVRMDDRTSRCTLATPAQKIAPTPAPAFKPAEKKLG